MGINGIMASAGVVVGIIISIIFIKICNKNGKITTEYDERQEAIRGRGFKYAMYSAWIMIGIYIVFEIGEVNIHMENGLVLFTILVISLMIQVSHSIWNDAYFGRNNSTRKYVIIFIVLTLINALAAVRFGMENMLVVDGMLTTKAINAECALIFVIIGIEYALKGIAENKEPKEE